MNIEYSEINNLEQENQNSNQYENYWEQPNPINTNSYNVKKPKITYNDILSSLNLVVQNGVLQKVSIPNTNSLTQNRQNFNPNSNRQNPNSKPNPNKQNFKTQPKKIEPQLKNSYIFNKYFKNFKDETVIEEPKKPLTKEEYKKMLIENYIKTINERKRIAQIKSKKIQYTNADNFVIKTSYNNANLNRLFRI